MSRADKTAANSDARKLLEEKKAAAGTTLFINMCDSRCGACNRSALPYDERHETPCGYDQHPGCGALFTSLSTDYFGVAGLEDRVKEMRPDLPYIDPMGALDG